MRSLFVLFCVALLIGCGRPAAEPTASNETVSAVPKAPAPEEAKVAIAKVDPAVAIPAADPKTAKTSPAPPEAPPEISEKPVTAAADSQRPAAKENVPTKDAPVGTAANTESSDAKSPNRDEKQPEAPPASAASTPAVPSADFDSADAIRQILDLLNERPSIRKAPGFSDSVCELADQVLASGAKPEHKITALLSKFKILHESAVDGDQKAEEKLRQLAQQHASYGSEKVTAYVRMVEMEKRLMAADKTPPAEVGKLIDELKAYLAKERLLDRHLRMASLSVDLVNKLDEKQREPRMKELGELYSKSPDLDLANYGQRLAGKIVGDAADSLTGKPLELVGTTAGGEMFKWGGYRDRIVIVDFWATWCGPCRKELPHLRETFDNYRRHGLEVVGVSLDNDMDALRKFLEDQSLPWVTLAGRSNQDLAIKYGVAGIPTMFLVDKEGKIVARAHQIAHLVPQIETLLKVKPTTPVKAE